MPSTDEALAIQTTDLRKTYGSEVALDSLRLRSRQEPSTVSRPERYGKDNHNATPNRSHTALKRDHPHLWWSTLTTGTPSTHTSATPPKHHRSTKNLASANSSSTSPIYVTFRRRRPREN